MAPYLNFTIDQRNWDPSLSIFNLLFSVLILVVGVLGNSLIIYIYLRVIKKSIRYYVPFLAVCDLLQIVVGGVFLLTISQFWTYPDETLCRIGMFLMAVLFDMAVSFILLATIHLYIFVTRGPGNNDLSKRNKRILASIVIIFCILYTAPTAPSTELQDIIVLESDNHTRVMEACLPLPKTEMTLLTVIHRFVGDGLVVLIAITLCFLYALTGRFLYKHLNRTTSLSETQADKFWSSVIYFIITIGNFVCYIPAAVVRITFFSGNNSQVYTRQQCDIMVLSYLFYLISSMMNPYICILGDRNAREYIKQFLQKCQTTRPLGPKSLEKGGSYQMTTQSVFKDNSDRS